jgi:hypothetical protein
MRIPHLIIQGNGLVMRYYIEDDYLWLLEAQEEDYFEQEGYFKKRYFEKRYFKE